MYTLLRGPVSKRLLVQPEIGGGQDVAAIAAYYQQLREAQAAK